ncbi:MAG: YedE family putative selenium transporter [Sphaerochaetaceae bacterium]|nr:YedE family putative selenium transporter [Sphaerochaetaceae bacterium]
MTFSKEKKRLLFAGIVVGAVSFALALLGNPKNMGFCIACFVRDMAGGVGLQRAEVVQYVRPEIIGLVLGACIVALLKKEFSPRGGSSPMLRLVLGFFVMVGALMFLGCPFRMIIRLAGGDLNALVGLAGFIAGIWGGVFFLNRGFSLKRNYPLPLLDGLALPIINLLLLVALIFIPALLFFSASGPGSMHAPIWASLLAGLIVGALAQRTRLCMVGGIRDTILFRDWTLLTGFVAIFITILVLNLATGRFLLGFANQPVAHTDGLWNFIGMVVVGFGSVLLGGCPLRQLVLAGEGNSDSAITVVGLLLGGAFAHNFGLASSAAGPALRGQVATVLGLVVMVVIAVCNTKQKTGGK